MPTTRDKCRYYEQNVFTSTAKNTTTNYLQRPRRVSSALQKSPPLKGISEAATSRKNRSAGNSSLNSHKSEASSLAVQNISFKSGEASRINGCHREEESSSVTAKFASGGTLATKKNGFQVQEPSSKTHSKGDISRKGSLQQPMRLESSNNLREPLSQSIVMLESSNASRVQSWGPGGGSQLHFPPIETSPKKQIYHRSLKSSLSLPSVSAKASAQFCEVNVRGTHVNHCAKGRQLKPDDVTKDTRRHSVHASAQLKDSGDRERQQLVAIGCRLNKRQKHTNTKDLRSKDRQIVESQAVTEKQNETHHCAQTERIEDKEDNQNKEFETQTELNGLHIEPIPNNDRGDCCTVINNTEPLSKNGVVVTAETHPGTTHTSYVSIQLRNNKQNCAGGVSIELRNKQNCTEGGAKQTYIENNNGVGHNTGILSIESNRQNNCVEQNNIGIRTIETHRQNCVEHTTTPIRSNSEDSNGNHVIEDRSCQSLKLEIKVESPGTRRRREKGVLKLRLVDNMVTTEELRGVPMHEFEERLREWKAGPRSEDGLPSRITQQFSKLKSVSPDHSKQAALVDTNKGKNRYTNILPYDHSRVKLVPLDENDPTTDYINANYIAGYHSKREYIATQGPLERTVEDFWRMVFEQKSPVIVMLSDLTEGRLVKVHKYFPDDDQINIPCTCGVVSVTLLGVERHRDYLVRTFRITVGGKHHTVKQFFIATWKDFEANLNPGMMVDFIKVVRHSIPPNSTHPIVTHCSAGVGRTGTFIAIDYFTHYIRNNPPTAPIDIYSFVLQMRDARLWMVQSTEQYVFIHDVVAELIRRKLEGARYDQPTSTQHGSPSRSSPTRTRVSGTVSANQNSSISDAAGTQDDDSEVGSVSVAESSTSAAAATAVTVTATTKEKNLNTSSSSSRTRKSSYSPPARERQGASSQKRSAAPRGSGRSDVQRRYSGPPSTSSGGSSGGDSQDSGGRVKRRAPETPGDETRM